MENTDIPPSVIITDFIMPPAVANPINAIALPTFALLAILITYLPLRSFYRVKNIAACSIMFVLFVINLMAFINGIVWPSDDWTKWWLGYVLCDIEVVIRYPITLALASSLCCLSKSLADALDTENACLNPSAKMRRRKMCMEVLFCWAVPVMQMVLHYTVQAGRYMVAPVWGCADQLDNSWPMIIIIIIWCPVFSTLNVYYAALMLIRLFRYRATISAALSSAGSGLAPRKFIKLAFISLLLITFYLPLSTLFVYFAIPKTLVPYSWSRIHNPETWSPILFIHTENQPSLQYYGWAGVTVSGLMFAFFGFNDDAVDTYRGFLVKCGAGKVWPDLKLSREERRARDLSDETLGSRGSFASHLDLVGKAMKYFDAGSRKESSATGITLVNNSMTSRKCSQGTFSNTTTSLSHAPTNTSNFSTFPLNQSFNTGNADIISPAPSHFNDSHFNFSNSPTTPSHPEILPPLPTTLAPKTPLKAHKGILSLFRTHLNIPFNDFTFASSPSLSSSEATNSSSRSQQPEPTNLSSTSRSAFDIEAQKKNPSWLHGTSAMPTQNPTTVSSKIWSGPGPASFLSLSQSQIDKDTEAIDFSIHAPPCGGDSPKMGSRAYRERERRELAQSTTQSLSSSSPTKSSHETKKENQTRFFAANVHRELGMDILPPTSAQKGVMGGVTVRRSLDIVEERTG
ncbi:uncharacterized protein RSE6_11453 [Rhynchosporium secalis]|uniref:Uncharacterized protein n=1 Tax=Rhynchosporium secalis TaxID=38038 RepID=A0A1E1MNZ0_RHYSE|nr:uncharacterized protein RSE6_11453 [Rhynchosporium secalis]